MTGPGFLLALEGIDGAGKSTLQRGLLDALRAWGYRGSAWREPSEGQYGAAARQGAGRDPWETAMLFTLDRAQTREELEAKLVGGRVVVSDRSYYSTLAYQGPRLSPRDREVLSRLQREVARTPDLVLLLDLEPACALQRVRGRGGASDFERLATLRRARRAYRALARAEPDRFIVLPARLPPEEIQVRADRALRERLPPALAARGKRSVL